MFENTVECPKCGTEFTYTDEQVGTTIACPSCAAQLELQWPEDESPAGTDSPKLPERMKANRLVDGRTCPKCGKGIFFGQDVHNCQTCGQTIHDGCWEDGGCPTCRKPSAPAWTGSDGSTMGQAQAPSGLAVSPGAPLPGSPQASDQKECRFCGELILAKARKCRHCNEYQNEADRVSAGGSKDVEDENLTTGEWILALLCSGIGCIVGIVWLCQGKKKGGKMLLISILGNIVLRLIMGLLR